jgi:mRNA capping enzyme
VKLVFSSILYLWLSADIAGTSVKQCEDRYNELVERVKRERTPQQLFSAQFITADCTKVGDEVCSYWRIWVKKLPVEMFGLM